MYIYAATPPQCETLPVPGIMQYPRKGYVAFDIETDGLFDGDEPPSITCACTIQLHRHAAGCFEPSPARHWHSDLEAADCMQQLEISELVTYLFSMLQNGYPPVTWNGAGFDFRVLHAKTQCIQGPQGASLAAKVVKLAKHGVDPMFSFFMHKGFPVGLSAVASGFDIKLNKSGKGVDAIAAWATGSVPERIGVINYCERDVAVLSMVTAAIDASNKIKWITKKYKAAAWTPAAATDALMGVAAAAKVPEPDNQWMTSRNVPGTAAPQRPTKSQFVGWYTGD